MNDLRSALFAAGVTVDRDTKPANLYPCATPKCAEATRVPYAFCERCAPQGKGSR